MKKNRFINVYNNFEEILLVTIFAFMVADIFLQVIMRYVFNDSLFWSEELGRFLFEWLTWIGISLGAKKGEHIKITMLLDKFSYKKAQVLNIISSIIVIAICAVTIYYGIYMCIFWAGSKFICLRISLAWGYLAIPVGCSLMVLRSLGHIWEAIKNIKAGNEEGGDM